MKSITVGSNLQLYAASQISSHVLRFPLVVWSKGFKTFITNSQTLSTSPMALPLAPCLIEETHLGS